MPLLGQPLAAFDDQLRQAHVALDVAVQAAGHHLALDAPLHVGDFFGPLVDQQHDQLHVGIVVRDGLADVLQHDRLAGPRRGDDQRALSLAQRREQVHHASRQRLLSGLESQPAFRIDRRQLVERLDRGIILGLHAVDVDELFESRTLLLAALLHQAVEIHPLAEAELVDHRAGHERIGAFPLIVIRGAAEKAVSVGMQLENAAARFDGAWLTVVGAGFELGIRWPRTTALIVAKPSVASTAASHPTVASASAPWATASSSEGLSRTASAATTAPFLFPHHTSRPL